MVRVVGPHLDIEAVEPLAWTFRRELSALRSEPLSDSEWEDVTGVYDWYAAIDAGVFPERPELRDDRSKLDTIQRKALRKEFGTPEPKGVALYSPYLDAGLLTMAHLLERVLDDLRIPQVYKRYATTVGILNQAREAMLASGNAGPVRLGAWDRPVFCRYSEYRNLGDMYAIINGKDSTNEEERLNAVAVEYNGLFRTKEFEKILRGDPRYGRRRFELTDLTKN